MIKQEVIKHEEDTRLIKKDDADIVKREDVALKNQQDIKEERIESETEGVKQLKKRKWGWGFGPDKTGWTE